MVDVVRMRCAPHRLQDGAVADEAARFSRQFRKDVTFLRRQVKCRADAGEEFVGVKRLGDVSVAARAEAQRLKRFAENLLYMVRIDSAALAPEMEVTDLTDAVTLAVVDAGPGLGTQAGDIFNTFVRGTGTDRSGGSGLGLAIVRGFADAMRVRVSAANAPDGGAVLMLRFGLPAPAAVQPALPRA